MYSRFDPEARIAVMQATEEARELGHSEVGPDHVLLGLLSNMRGSTFALLTEHGLRLDSAREVVVAQRAALAETQQSPTGKPDSDASDEGSTDSDPNLDRGLDEDREALRAIGIDLDKVREAVRSTFGDDLTEQWGERQERRGRRGQRGRRHHGGGGRGRRGPRSRQFADRGEFSDSLIGILRDLRHSTMRDASLERTERRGERGERGDRRQRGPALTADRLLFAIARSEDPVAQAVLGWANDAAALRATIEARATQPAG
jgi:hypothetical protein